MHVIFKVRPSGGWSGRRPNDKYLDGSPCFGSREPLRAQVGHRARDHPCRRPPPVLPPRLVVRVVPSGCVIWSVASGAGGAAPTPYAAHVAPSGMNAAAMSASRMLEDLGYVVGLITLGLASTTVWKWRFN